MTKWPKDAKEFTVSVTFTARNNSSVSHIPKPILRLLGNPKRITFTIHDDYITVDAAGDLA